MNTNIERSQHNVLIVSSVAPEKFGSVKRLFYDILCANQNFSNAIYYITIPYTEERPSSIPESYNFIPWSKILYRESLKPNRSFKGIKIRKDWRCFSKVHIDASSYDLIVAFPFGMAALDFVGFKGILFALSIDSSSMIFARAVIKHTNLFLKIASVIRLMQNGWLDWTISQRADFIYLVGESDAYAYNVFFNRIKNVIYIPHTVIPEIRNMTNLAHWDGKSKLNLLFAGSLSPFYTGRLLHDYIKSIVKADLQDSVRVIFLGQNKGVKELSSAGYEIDTINFVPSFEDFLVNMHIMLVPLLVGGGTKNRILSALGCGMDVIGSRVACENIYGIKDENIADNGDELIDKIKIRIAKGKIFQLTDSEREQYFIEHGLGNWEEKLWSKMG